MCLNIAYNFHLKISLNRKIKLVARYPFITKIFVNFLISTRINIAPIKGKLNVNNVYKCK